MTEARTRRLELVVFVGLQASGKSTFYRERFASTHELISKDLLRGSRREARQLERLRLALSAGRSVVVDNTNVHVEARAPLVAMGRAYGARIVAYVFTSPIAECLVRNAAREGRALVPPVALHATRRRLQWPDPSEGFDVLHSVRLLSSGGFEVAGWPPP